MRVGVRPTDEDYCILCIRGVFLPYEMQRPLQRPGVRPKKALTRYDLLTDTGMQTSSRFKSGEDYSVKYCALVSRHLHDVHAIAFRPSTIDGA